MVSVVLVHGAFHGAWCWTEVIPLLEELGHKVSAIDLPGSGSDGTPADTVSLELCAQRVLGAMHPTEATVLVGHSSGGAVITQVGALAPERVANLIYVSAFLPADGQSAVDLTREPEGAGDLVQANMIVTPPTASMPPSAAYEAFYGDTPRPLADWAVSKLTPQPLSVMVSPVSVKSVLPPRRYVVCELDRSIPPALQQRMARSGTCSAVAALRSDHSPFLSHPDELVELLAPWLHR